MMTSQSKNKKLAIRFTSLIFLISIVCLFSVRADEATNPTLVLKMGHSSPIRTLGFSVDDSLLVSVDYAGDAFVWQKTNGNLITQFNILRGSKPVFLSNRDLIFTEKAGILRSAFPYDKRVLILPTNAKGDVPTILAVSPDGIWMVCEIGVGTIQLRRVDSGNGERTLIRILSSDQAEYSARFDSSSKTVAIGTDDGRVWLTSLGGPITHKTFTGLSVESMTFDGDRLLLCGSAVAKPDADSTTENASKVAGKNDDLDNTRTRIIEYSTGTDVIRPTEFLVHPQLSSDGKGVFFSSVRIGYSTLVPWHETFTSDDSSSTLMAGVYAVSHLGEEIAQVNLQNQIVVSNLKTGENHPPISGPIRPVKRIQWVPGSVALVASSSSFVDVWNGLDGARDVERYTDNGGVGYSGNGEALAYFESRQLRVMDRRTGSIRSVGTPAGLPLARRVIGMSFDAKRVFWIESVLISTVFSLDISDTTAAPEEVCKLSQNGFSIVSNPSGSMFLAHCTDFTDSSSASVQDGLYFIDAQTLSKTFFRSVDSELLAGAVSLDNKQVALASRKEIEIFNLPTAASRKLEGRNNARYSSLTFNGDGTKLVAGIYVDRTRFGGGIQIWDLITEEHSEVMEHTAPVTGILISNNATIFSSSDDGTILVYDGLTHAPLVRMISAADQGWVTVSPDGLFDGTSDAMQYVGWRASPGALPVSLDAFFDDFYQPGLLSDFVFGSRPRAEKVSLASRLQIPGIKAMIQKRLVGVMPIRGRTYLCLPERPTSGFFGEIGVWSKGREVSVNEAEFVSVDPPKCAYGEPLPGVFSDYQITDAKPTHALAKLPNKLNDSGLMIDPGTVIHIVTVAESPANPTASLPALLYPNNDARAITDFLIQSFARGTKIRVEVESISNEGFKTVEEKLTQAALATQPQDILIVFMSGHGVVPPGDRMFYFLTSDVKGNQQDQERAAGISTVMLSRLILSANARRVVLIIDACQSGGSLDSLGKVAEAKVRIDQRINEVQSTSFATGVYIIAAATPFEQAIETKSEGHGKLATLMLKGLGSGVKSADGLARYLEQYLHADTVSTRYPQTPLIASSGVDIPLGSQ